MSSINCKVCNNNELVKLEGKRLRAPYYHCKRCDLIFVSSEALIYGEEERERYSRHNNSLENEGYVNMFKRFIESALLPFRAQLTNALDYGSGPGPVLAHLLDELGLEVEHYDPYFSPEKVYQGKKYSLITSTEVFEHFKEPAKELELLTGLLKPGGLLAIMTHFHLGDYERFKKWWYIIDNTHCTFYSRKSFDFIAERQGLKVVYCNDKNIIVLKKMESS